MNRGEQDPTDPLHDRLRSVDPAASLPPADRDAVARLLEDTMTDPHTEESRLDGTRHRSPLTWLVAAAAAVLIVGGGAFALSQGGDDEDAPSVADGGAAPAQPDSSDPSLTTLTVDGAVAGRCMPPSAELIGRQQVAFAGTVTGVSGGTATLTPSRWYAGEATDQVTVQAPSADLTALLAAVDFREDERYLVSATDGAVTLCGLTGPDTARLEALYDEAFGG